VSELLSLITIMAGQKNFTRKEIQKRYYEKNKAKVYAATRKWILANKERWEESRHKYLKSKPKEYHRNRVMKCRYGVDIEWFKAQLDRQGFSCLICKGGLDMSSHIDHDHESGKVRGILCRRCNMGIGSFEEDVVVMANAIAYLENNKNNGNDTEAPDCS
jgi:hypothetical protein